MSDLEQIKELLKENNELKNKIKFKDRIFYISLGLLTLVSILAWIF